MATYNNVDKSGVNALYLIGIMKDVISDVRKQDTNKTSNDKSKSKDGKKITIMPTQLMLLTLKIVQHGKN